VLANFGLLLFLHSPLQDAATGSNPYEVVLAVPLVGSSPVAAHPVIFTWTGGLDGGSSLVITWRLGSIQYVDLRQFGVRGRNCGILHIYTNFDSVLREKGHRVGAQSFVLHLDGIWMFIRFKRNCDKKIQHFYADRSFSPGRGTMVMDNPDITFFSSVYAR
jgi:hypothetical protein